MLRKTTTLLVDIWRWGAWMGHFMFTDKEHSILSGIGSALAALFFWRTRSASVSRNVKISMADAQAFERLSHIAEMSERQLEKQSLEFAARREELAAEKQFYVEQTEKLMAETERLRKNNAELSRNNAELSMINSELRAELAKMRQTSNTKAA